MTSFLQVVWLAACFILFTNVALAVGADLSNLTVTITASENSESTSSLISAIRSRVPQATIQSANQIATNNYPLHTVHIAIGPIALRALSALPTKNPHTSIISVHTSSVAYRQIRDETQHRRTGVSAIYNEPSPANQLRLIQAIYRRPLSVAVLIQSATHVIPLLRDAAANTQIDLTIHSVRPGESVYRALNSVRDGTVLLAIPDPAIYNNDTIRNLLIASYRREQAVVGFSPAIVKAGALATTTSDSNDTAAQLEELLGDYISYGRLPSEQFPKYFNVVVNDSVARSLNVLIDDGVRQLARKPKDPHP